MLKRKLTPLVLLLSFAFIGARCYQYMYLIDSTTGYYTPHVFNTLMVVFAAVCCAFFSRRRFCCEEAAFCGHDPDEPNTFFLHSQSGRLPRFCSGDDNRRVSVCHGGKDRLADILTTVFALLTVIYFAYIFINGGSPATGSGMHLFPDRPDWLYRRAADGGL